MTTLAPAPTGLLYDPLVATLHLKNADPVLGELIDRAGEYTLRPPPTLSLFAALTVSIIHQQLSGTAAATIQQRVIALFAPKRFPAPRDVLAIDPARLRSAGLSNAKTAALRDLAARTVDGTVPPMAQVRRMEDEAIIERLTLVRGVGRRSEERRVGKECRL